jgi:putative transposase
MKGKRHTTEEKIRALREVDGGKPIRGLRQEKNIPVTETTYHRWQKEFGMMEVNGANGLKALEREDAELKKMLAESFLKNRVLGAVCKRSSEPGRAPATHPAVDAGRCVLNPIGLPACAIGPVNLPISGKTGDRGAAGDAPTVTCVLA